MPKRILIVPWCPGRFAAMEFAAAAMDSRLFLQFLALIYTSSIRTKIQNDEKLKYMVVRETMEEMETLTKIKYSNRYGQVYTVQSQQSPALDQFQGPAWRDLCR